MGDLRVILPIIFTNQVLCAIYCGRKSGIKTMGCSKKILKITLSIRLVSQMAYKIKFCLVVFLGKYYFADLRMTFRQNFFLQDWFRNKLGV